MRLSQERLIDILPSRGFRLHHMSQADVWETYQLRTAVEGFCALHLAHRKETDQGAALLDALEASVARMEAQGEQTDLEEYWAEDFAFHRLLVEFSGNQEFLQLFESYHYRMSVIAKESFHSPNRRAVAGRSIRPLWTPFAAAAAGTTWRPMPPCAVIWRPAGTWCCGKCRRSNRQ